MWPGHAAGDRVDRVADLDALLLELVGHLLDGVLGLGDGEPVAGDDHDGVGVGERDRRVLGADRAVRALLARAAAAAGRARRRSRRRGRWRPSGSSPSPSPSSGSFPRSRRACRRRSARRCRARSRRRPRRGRWRAFSSEITTGMSAPPIGSTARMPSSAAAIRTRDEEQLGGVVGGRCRGRRRRRATPSSSSALMICWPGTRDRAGRDQVLELAEGDVRAPERDRADHRGEEDRDELVEREVGADREAVAELRPGDQGDRAAADAVVEGDHLRHLGHLHADRGDHADRAADERGRRR